MWRADKNLKHQRLKILSKRCRLPDLPMSQWLKQPGVLQASSRLQHAEAELIQRHASGHDLIWNRQVGKLAAKPDYGDGCGVQGVVKQLRGGTLMWRSRLLAGPSSRCHRLPLGSCNTSGANCITCPSTLVPSYIQCSWKSSSLA